MIYVHGDTHGGYHSGTLNSSVWTKQKQLTIDDTLIILGDFGYLWEQEMSNQEKFHLNTFANKKYEVAFIDGNHENFDRVNSLLQVEKWGGKVGMLKMDKGNVYHLKRGEVYTINDKTIFVMGGALSVDKNTRTPKIDWWQEEAHSYADIENALTNLEKHNFNVDVVLTHTCPSSIIQHILDTELYIDNDKIHDSASVFFDALINDYSLKFKEWHFGHFHIEKSIGNFYCHFYNLPVKLL